MSKKPKEKSIPQEVEEELVRLSSGDSNNGSSSAKDFFEEMLRQQAIQNATLLKSMQDASLSLVSAVKEAVTVKPAPPAITPPAIDGSLYDPAANPLETIEDATSDEEADFEGWDFAPSGKVSDGITAEAQGSASTSKQVDLDDDLFMA